MAGYDAPVRSSSRARRRSAVSKPSTNRRCDYRQRPAVQQVRAVELQHEPAFRAERHAVGCSLGNRGDGAEQLLTDAGRGDEIAAASRIEIVAVSPGDELCEFGLASGRLPEKGQRTGVLAAGRLCSLRARAPAQSAVAIRASHARAPPAA